MSKFKKVFKEIKEINLLETKDLTTKLVKFNEEYGEMCAEIVNYYGKSPRPYSKKKLKKEMADVMIVLLAVYDDIEKLTDISMSQVLDEVKNKNIKWKENIKKYKDDTTN